MKRSPFRLAGFAVLALLPLNFSSIATAVDIDLSGATSASLINAPGGSFATLFAGQSTAGAAGVSGSPTGPLALQAANNLVVANFNPGVSASSNSILPEPGNAGPLSVLLDTAADSITWTMGSAAPPSSVDIDFFDNNGALVNTVNQSLSSGYAVYTFSGLGTFRGLTIRDNNDASGLRYQNFSYNAVPEPAALSLALGLALAGFAARRR